MSKNPQEAPVEKPSISPPNWSKGQSPKHKEGVGKKKIPRSDNDFEDVGCGSKRVSPAGGEMKNSLPRAYKAHGTGAGGWGENFQSPNIRNHALTRPPPTRRFPGHVSLSKKRTRHLMPASLKHLLLWGNLKQRLMLDCPTYSSLPSIRVWSRNINFLSGIIKYRPPKIQFSLKPNRMFTFPCPGPSLTSSAVLNGAEREK